ncbi:hypothetical protein L596_003910 [Steinernema carpocapsae]|uniref:Uncharacterized protein n=1 Tax=Steinernema carpocapsae TaxID=34508 RepID=A0A4U8UU16_STECR|nr:hypothetical protein L596_003910 [Steinernema carpocapsae]
MTREALEDRCHRTLFAENTLHDQLQSSDGQRANARISTVVCMSTEPKAYCLNHCSKEQLKRQQLGTIAEQVVARKHARKCA